MSYIGLHKRILSCTSRTFIDKLSQNIILIGKGKLVFYFIMAKTYFERILTLLCHTPPTKSLWTVLPAADSTLTVRLFQEVAVWKPLYINLPNKFCFKGHILYSYWQKMITIGFMGTMYVCLLNKPIELYYSTTYFAISLMSLQIFSNISKTPDRVHFTKFMV